MRLNQNQHQPLGGNDILVVFQGLVDVDARLILRPIHLPLEVNELKPDISIEE